VDDSKIHAQEEFVHKLFGEDYLYQIPKFQRPFSWTQGNFVDLVDDLTDAYDVNADGAGRILSTDDSINKENKERYEPYFLGSIILNEGAATGDRYDVIDGQQRLTSLSILVAVLRDRVEHPQWQASLAKLVKEEEDFVKGKASTVRLKIRDRDQEFFEEHVLKPGATSTIYPPEDGETEPEQNILQAIETFDERLDEWADSERELIELAAFIAQCVVMVRIMTDSLSSAFRLFNVTNARGMPLNNADLLKSENLSTISEDGRDEYQRKWEDMEEEVGNEGLERFIGYVRHMLVKEKPRRSIYDEFRDNVFPRDPDLRGKRFVEYLQQVFDTHRDRVYDATLRSDAEAKNVYYHNIVSLMRDFYPSDEWIVALVGFDQQYDDEDALHEFVTKLERRLTVDWLTGASFSDRYTRVYQLLREIEAAEDFSLGTLTEDVVEDRDSFEEALDLKNFYRKGNYQWPKYILMRVNMERHDNRNVKIQYGNNLNVEHILPRNPSNGYWGTRFDELHRGKWTNRLGNLVLLDGRKNYRASNRPFPEKYEQYFEKKNDFAITNELDSHDKWTPTLLEERHERLKSECLSIWVESATEDSPT
jgi:hypothetical protein